MQPTPKPRREMMEDRQRNHRPRVRFLAAFGSRDGEGGADQRAGEGHGVGHHQEQRGEGEQAEGVGPDGVDFEVWFVCVSWGKEGGGMGSAGCAPFGTRRLSTGGRNQEITARGSMSLMVPRRKYQNAVPGGGNELRARFLSA